MAVLIVYLISMVAWGLILLDLTTVIYNNRKNSLENPPLLIPLSVASLALFIESIYFGASAFFRFYGYDFLFDITVQQENWFLVKFLIALSGILLLIDLKLMKNGRK
jgi:hypothetical protein